jgi:hypothetical protein
MAWAGVEARRWRWDYLALFSATPIEAHIRKNHPSPKKMWVMTRVKAFFKSGFPASTASIFHS